MSQKELQQAIQRLVDNGQAKSQDYVPHEPRQSIAGGRAKSTPSGGSDTAGIASPLTEPDINAREYHGTPLTSSDGLFTMPSVKKVVMEDANGREVVLQYDDPANLTP